MLALDLIALRAPEHSGDSRLAGLLELAEELLGSKIPTETPREYCKALQVLHWITLSDRASEGGGVGAITEEREGELAVKYGNAQSNLMHYTSDWKAELGQTVWGLELYAMIKKYIVPVVVGDYANNINS